jgi:hypothetical protein
MNSPGKHAWQIRAAEQHTPEINCPVGINSEQKQQVSGVSSIYSEQLARQAVISVTTHGPPYELPRFCGLTTILPKQPVPPQYLVILLRLSLIGNIGFRLAAQYLPQPL